MTVTEAKDSLFKAWQVLDGDIHIGSFHTWFGVSYWAVSISGEEAELSSEKAALDWIEQQYREYSPQKILH